MRTTAAAVLAALIATTGAVAEPPPTAAELAHAAREAVLERVRAASDHGRDGFHDDAHDDDDGDEEAESRPAATTELAPDRASTLESSELGVTAVFSGNDLDAPVTLELAEPESAMKALRSAASETAGVAVGEVVEIVATDADGGGITSFPAELVDVPDDDPAHGPDIVDVLPGITLTFDVDGERVREAGVDPSTLRIYTREAAGQPWAELPSYFDEESGTVRGESDHLSQFVVIGIPFEAPERPRVVLDPDNDEADVTTPAPATEFPYNWQLVSGLRTMLEQRCLAQVVLTRPAGVPFVSRATRAGVAEAADPVATVGFGFNAWLGHGWGNESEGGTLAFSRGDSADDALRSRFVSTMPSYTGRPAEAAASTPNFPFDAFAGVPGAYAHVETLFLDHNYDRPVIDNAFGAIVDGAFRSLGGYLESRGFDCTDPVTGGWPSPPSQAQLKKWRHLGYQNYQTYGADPVSFSTGNLVESVPLFALPGPGEQMIDATLVYNAQDGRLSRVGAGWSFGLGARAQRFDDGSVLTVRGDGASFVFEPDGTGGYESERGTGLTLTEAGGGRLRLADRDGATWVFDADDIEGIGELVSYTDPHGQELTFAYGPADPDSQEFLPLTSITDEAGQTVTVDSDGKGRITRFSLPDGRDWTLAYDRNGNLVRVTDAAGGVSRFTYDDDHRMLTATDPEGVRYLVNEYDTAGRIVRQEDAEGNERTFAYSAGRTEYVDNEGGEHVFTYDGQFRITGIQDPAGGSADWAFDADGNVTSYTDEADRTTTYAYDAEGRVTSETDPSGATTVYTYTPDGDVATVTDALGRETVYSYDARGLVTRVDRADGSAMRYTYTPAGDLRTAVLPSGATTSYGYDARGNLASITDPLGRITQYDHDRSNRLTSVTDPAGGVTAYSWDAADRLRTVTDPTGAETAFRYDRNGNLTRTIDPTGGETRYVWDELWRVVRVTAPDGGETTFVYDGEDNLTETTDPIGATTAFVLDDAYRTAGVIDPNGGEWRRQLDASGVLTAAADPTGAVTTYVLDTLGRVAEVVDPTGASTAVAYDAVGRVVSQTDAAGATTTFAYDALDRITKVTDTAGFFTEYVYDIDGNLVGVINRSGHPTLYEVDAAGQVVSMTDATGATEVYAYDRAGRVVEIIDADGRATTFTYDAVGRVTAVIDPLGAETAYEYDAMGRLTAEIDPLGAETTSEYDAMGRVLGETDPTGAVTSYRYDLAGRQTAVVDPIGTVTAYGYDPAGRLVQVTEGAQAGEPSDGDTNVITGYAYTPTGLLARVTGPTGAVTTFEYDAAGRPLIETGPTGITTTTSYDSAGRVARVSNGAGLVAAYQYDERGDIASLTRADGAIEFEYDSEQRPIAMTDPTGVTGWVYDEVGRLTEQLDSNGDELAYTYTTAGLPASLSYPDGTATGYEYDEAGRPVTQSTSEGPLGYTWDDAGRLTGITRPNDVTTSLTYDPAGRATSIVHATPRAEAPTDVTPEPEPPLATEVDECRGVVDYLASREIPTAGGQHPCVKAWDYLERRTGPEADPAAPPGAQLRYDYRYDPAGNVTAGTRTITDPSADAELHDVLSRDFAYDALSRLTESTASTGEVNAYGYDPAGNRTSWKRSDVPGEDDIAVEAVFDPAGQLREVMSSGTGSASYSYDQAGHRASQTVDGVSTDFSYDPSGLLTGTRTEGRSTSYEYDGLGRRVASVDNTEFGAISTTQSWDGWEPVFSDDLLHGGAALVRGPLGGVVLQAGGGGSQWLLGDRRNVTATTDGVGALTDLVDYSDYGRARFESAGWGSLVGNDGQPGDVTLGLDAYLSRSYDVGVGSWTGPDRWRGDVGAPQSLNRYAYVGGNPVTFGDVWGFVAFRPDGGGGVGRIRALSASIAAKQAAKGERIRMLNRTNAMRSTAGRRRAYVGDA